MPTIFDDVAVLEDEKMDEMVDRRLLVELDDELLSSSELLELELLELNLSLTLLRMLLTDWASALILHARRAPTNANLKMLFFMFAIINMWVQR